MATYPVEVPSPVGAFQRPSTVTPGSLTEMPGEVSRPQPVEKLSSSELSAVAAMATELSGRFISYLADREAEILRAGHAAKSEWGLRTDLPAAERRNISNLAAAPHRKRTVQVTEPDRAAKLAEIAGLADRIALQGEFWRSPVRALQSFAWSPAAAPYTLAFASAGVAVVLAGFGDAMGLGNAALAGCVLSAFNNLSENDQKVARARGFDAEQLAVRILGAQYDEARAALRAGRLALMEAQSADKGFVQGNPLGDATDNLTIARLREGYDE